jgi:chromosome segregation ATPase
MAQLIEMTDRNGHDKAVLPTKRNDEVALERRVWEDKVKKLEDQVKENYDCRTVFHKKQLNAMNQIIINHGTLVENLEHKLEKYERKLHGLRLHNENLEFRIDEMQSHFKIDTQKHLNLMQDLKQC